MAREPYGPSLIDLTGRKGELSGYRTGEHSGDHRESYDQQPYRLRE